MPEDRSNQVFVVMQIGETGSLERKRADDIFDFVIRPVVEDHGLRAYRADLDPSPGSITPKMLTELLTSRAVVADLTGRNPNVNYELGIVHSFARPVVCIAETTDALPFDTKDERTIPVGKVPEGGLPARQAEDARRKLKSSLDVILAEDYVPPSPVRDAAGTQSLDNLAPDNPMAAQMERMAAMIELLTHRSDRPKVIESPSLRNHAEALQSIVSDLIQTGRISGETLREAVDGVEFGTKHHAWWRGAAEAADAADAAKSRSWGQPVQADPWAQPGQTDPWAQPAKSDSPETDPWAKTGDDAPF